MSKAKQPAPNNKKRSLIWSVLLAILVLLIGGSLTWWLVSPGQMLLGLTSTFFASTFVALLCFSLLQRKAIQIKTPDQQRLLLQKRTKLLTLHFKRMLGVQKRKKRLNSRYDQPIYLLLSDDPAQDKSIITQMGYEAYKADDFGNDIEFPVLFWLSEHSILISVSLGRRSAATVPQNTFCLPE